MERNLKAKANSKNPNTTFTEFSQPPDFGRDFIHSGNMANKVNGIANAMENANIPKIGLMSSPPAEEIKMDPTMGPVQEKETNTKVKAMKNTPAKPPFSALASTLLTKLDGRFISNNPKKAKAKKMKTPKKKRLGTQWVANQFANSGPWIAATAVPATV